MHISVLLNESIDSLNIKEDGIYVDCTLGYAGHSSEILKRIKKGRLVAFDQDQIAINASNERLKKIGDNYTIVKSNFVYLKEKLLELAQQDNPFNLTMLTVDTHFEDGYVCDICPDTFGDNQYANVMACSSRQVKEFIDWVQQQDFAADTTIVISGDHQTMDSDFCEDVDKDYERRVYTTYINAGAEKQTNEKRNYTTFDNFPTTLAAMGVEIEGDRLGLGTNLYSTQQTLTE